ncbi:MAG: DinB family protein [Gemmatimonadota bacterium]
MNAKDELRRQFEFLYYTVDVNTEGLSQEDSLRQPEPGGNCANWILGHLTVVQNRVLDLLGEAPILEHPNLPVGEQPPITGPGNALPFAEMRDEFLGSAERCTNGVAGLTDAQLDERGFVDPFGKPTTRGSLISFLAFHQAYHAGQLGLSRRLAGFPGAIAAPAATPLP